MHLIQFFVSNFINYFGTKAFIKIQKLLNSKK
jgi:hypothetical protein